MIKINWDKFYEDYDDSHKIKIHIQKPRYDNDMAELVKFLKKAARPTYHSKYKSESDKVEDFNFNNLKKTPVSLHLYNIDSKKQFCVHKLRYATSRQVHQKYLEHYMVQEDKDNVKNKPELFGNISKEQYLKKMNNSCFKWILSPERNLSVDQLKIVAETFISKCQQYTGKKFDWQGAVHTDTEHHHVHILVNGLDQEGNKFKFPKKFIKKYSYEMMSEFLTQMLGERTPDEIAAVKEKKITAERFTELDTLIEQAQIKNDNPEYPTVIRTTDLRLRKRLEFLTDLKIAKFDNEQYYMQKDWQETLRTSGRYNTFGKARYDYKFYNRELKLYTERAGKIAGTVSRYYNMNDEDIWNNAIIVNDKDGKTAWYVPLYKEGDKYFNSDIELNMSTNQKGLLVPKIKVVKKAAESGREIESGRIDIPEIEKKQDNNIEY